MKLGITNADFDAVGQWLNKFLYPADTGEKNGNMIVQYISYL
jgi:hypothetical protein